MRTNKMKRTSLSRKAGTRTRLRIQRNLLIISLLASLAMIGWLVLGNSTNNAKDFSPQIKSVQQDIHAGDMAHAKRIEQLQQNAIQLRKQVNNLNAQASDMQSQASVIREQTSYWAELIEDIPVTQSDTFQKLAGCDSLRQQVTELINTEQHKDSIVNMQIWAYEDLITAKDSTISAAGEDYTYLRMQADTLMQINEDLNKEYSKASRKIRRAKRWNRIAGGLAILLASGFTIRELYLR